jgi:Ca-activated chloride channel family protein
VNIAIDQPWWLLLSLVGVVSGVLGWRWMRGIPRFRRSVVVLMRVVLFVILGIAMSGVYHVEKANDLAVIAVVDTSMSVQNFAEFGVDELGLPITIDMAARGFLANASGERMSDDRLGVIAFDGRAQTIALPTKSQMLDRTIEIEPVEGSDLAGALLQARAQLPPDANARIVVFSDGRTTTGGLNQIPSDIPIDVVPVRYAVEHEVIVESVELPARSLPESIVDVRVVLRSLGDSTGNILLSYNAEPLDLNGDDPGVMQSIQLDPGQRVLVFPVQLSSARVHRFEAQYIPDPVESSNGETGWIGETSLGNNQAGGVTMTSGDGRVLVVAENDESEESQARSLVNTLQRSGWTIDVVTAGQFPSDLLDLEAYDLVVLVNTPRDSIQIDADQLIQAYVSDLGGGVIFVGGREALGAGGWQGSSIEEILPVKLDVADDLIVPQVAVVMVLDSSGSMSRKVMGSSRSQQAVANDAAGGALEILDEKDLVGVVAFSNSARRVIGIGPNDQPETARSSIGSITSSGGTNMAPALNMAKDMLTSVEANTKHIVLLSDGESQNPESLPALAQELGQLGIKVSTIAVGDQADERGMREIAKLSGGVYYRVRNPSVLPRIFIKAIRVVRTPMVREGIVSPVLLENDTPATGLLGSLPELSGLVITEQVTDDPRISTPIVSSQGEPIFAFHQVELGRVSVFTSDVSRWSRLWIESDVFSTFWTNAANWTMRDAGNEPGELSLVVRNAQAQIEYNAIDNDGAPIDGLDVSVQVFDDSGRSREIDLIQVGSGQYTGEVDDLGSGVHVVIASPKRTGSSGQEPLKPTIAGLQITGVDEFKYLRADPRALVDLAERTGGRIFDLTDPASANLFDRTGLIERQSLQPIWTLLIVIAFILFVLDLASRRVAFDRWIAQARDETIAVSRAVRAEQVEQLKASMAAVEDRKSDAPEMDRSPMRASAPAAKEHDQAEVESTSDNPLMAAKRRARERMNED